MAMIAVYRRTDDKLTDVFEFDTMESAIDFAFVAYPADLFSWHIRPVAKLMEVAQMIRPIVTKAVEDLGSDLMGWSVVDLVCDNLDLSISTADIKSALVCAGVDPILSDRLIRSYSRR